MNIPMKGEMSTSNQMKDNDLWYHVVMTKTKWSLITVYTSKEDGINNLLELRADWGGLYARQGALWLEVVRPNIA